MSRGRVAHPSSQATVDMSFSVHPQTLEDKVAAPAPTLTADAISAQLTAAAESGSSGVALVGVGPVARVPVCGNQVRLAHTPGIFSLDVRDWLTPRSSDRRQSSFAGDM